MGLGKTVITIAAAEELIERGEIGGGLVIVPADLKHQWRKQILAFTEGKANVQVIEGSQAQRMNQYQLVKSGQVEYAIMNYEQVVNDWQWVRRLPRDFIVLDEATYIKGFKSKRSKKIKQLKADYKWALTGQPVENRPEEIFSIMEWVDENLFGPYEIFDPHFIVRWSSGKVRKIKNIPTFNRLLNKRMVRISRDTPGVKEQLPQVVEESYVIDFDPAGAKLYRRIATELIDLLASIDAWGFDIDNYYTGAAENAPEGLGDIMSRVMCLRMLCDHPELLWWSADLADGTTDPKSRTLARGSAYAAMLKATGQLDKLGPSRKLETTVELIEEILDANPKNKVVLFSFFKEQLRIIGDRMEPKTGVAHFNGDIKRNDREANKVRFQTDPNCRLFLSSDAGGYGVDLPQANYLLCVKADMPVLTDHLKWVPAGSLQVGDGLLAFEEYARGGRGNSRRWQRSQVTNNRIALMECVSVLLSNGESLIVTPQHPLLVQTGKGDTRWVEAQHLKKGWRVHKYLQPWEDFTCFEAGWMSGLLDGEGCACQIGHGLAVTLTQNRGPVLDRALCLAKERGFVMRDTGRAGHCPQYAVGGGAHEATRFLGQFQPMRLIPTWIRLLEEHTIRAVESPTVVGVEPAGVHEVSVLGTSTSTFFGAGYAQHNSYDLPWSAGAWKQRNARIIRLSSEFDSVTLISMLMAGSIEERQYEALEMKQMVASALIDGKGYDEKGGLSFGLDSLGEFLAGSSV